MKFDEYELDLIDAIDNSKELERVDNIEDEIREAKLAAKMFLTKTKNINIRIPEFDMLLLKLQAG